MKAVMISIRPKWVELIALNKKTYELRKTYPRLDTPFKCYIYMTRYSWAFNLLHQYRMDDLAERLAVESGMVVGEFMCSAIDTAAIPTDGEPICNMSIIENACLTRDEVIEYGGGKTVYAWRISEPKFYDKPYKLTDFCREEQGEDFVVIWPVNRAPQSWQYVEELE